MQDQISPPYGYAQLCPSAITREIERIKLDASKDTRVFYEIGDQSGFPGSENWVIRWLLWHAIRYSDNRTEACRARKGHRTRAFSSGSADSVKVRGSMSSSSSGTAMLDSTRLQFMPPQTTLLVDAVGSGSTAPNRTEFWDPIREV